jgi:ubiquinone/menaquinone biosynthesis C-methylase UbiE
MSDENEGLINFYEGYDESNRLFKRGELEFERTKDVIRESFPPAPATVLDVGGGPGAYAFWLAEEGYSVHLIDAVPKHIDQAREQANQHPDAPLTTLAVGDARHLEHEDGSADAILLLGPLYHLVDIADRHQSLTEAFRVLRDGGVAILGAISRHTSLMGGLMEGGIHTPVFADIVRQDLKDGQHRNPPGHHYFTDAIFHLPEELEEEAQSAGFIVEDTLAIEGPASWIPNIKERWAEEQKRRDLLEFARQTARDSAIIGASVHFAVVARKRT